MDNLPRRETLYVNREDFRQVEEEERNNYLLKILENIGVPVEGLFENNSIKNRIKLKELLSKYKVTVVLESSGDMDIYYESDLIAKWFKPRYILRQDHSEPDPSKKLFFEMILDYVSVWDETQEEENE